MYSNKLANFESDYDLVALGIQNVWICEVGSKEMHGSFENFTTFILNSSVSINFHIKLICKHIFSYFSFTFINPDPFFQIWIKSIFEYNVCFDSRLKFPIPMTTVSLSVWLIISVWMVWLHFLNVYLILVSL